MAEGATELKGVEERIWWGGLKSGPYERTCRYSGGRKSWPKPQGLHYKGNTVTVKRAGRGQPGEEGMVYGVQGLLVGGLLVANVQRRVS